VFGEDDDRGTADVATGDKVGGPDGDDDGSKFVAIVAFEPIGCCSSGAVSLEAVGAGEANSPGADVDSFWKAGAPIGAKEGYPDILGLMDGSETASIVGTIGGPSSFDP